MPATIYDYVSLVIIHGKKDDFVLYSLMPVIVDEMMADK